MRLMVNKDLIWIVDDDESIRWVLKKGFSEEGLLVKTFESAQEVLKNLNSETPKAILTDIKMPGSSGLELLDQIREIRPSHIRIRTWLLAVQQTNRTYWEKLALFNG